MADYKKVAQINAFFNADKLPNSNRPDWSNSKAKIDTTIDSGEYSIGVWKSEKGLSIKIEKRLDDAVPAQPDGGDIGSFDDI